MSLGNSHQIAKYYDFYRDKEIIFTKANLKALRMDPRQFFIKCNGGQWPCIINSTSFQMAKVLIGTSSGVYAAIQKTTGLSLSLRYCFINSNGEPVPFFINCNVVDVHPYENSPDLVIMTLYFTQRPPDDLIERLGEFIEVNENFKNRREERITINQNTLKILGIQKEETVVFISDVPRRCILKDLSFSGARIMTVGIPKFLIGKKIYIILLFNETNEKIKISGIIKNADFFPGRKDIAIVHIQFDEEEIPISYKFHVNSYITSYQKQIIENQIKNEENQQKAEAAAQIQSEKRAALIAASVQKEKEEEKRLQAEKAEKETVKFIEGLMGKIQNVNNN